MSVPKHTWYELFGRWHPSTHTHLRWAFPLVLRCAGSCGPPVARGGFAWGHGCRSSAAPPSSIVAKRCRKRRWVNRRHPRQRCGIVWQAGAPRCPCSYIARAAQWLARTPSMSQGAGGLCPSQLGQPTGEGRRWCRIGDAARRTVVTRGLAHVRLLWASQWQSGLASISVLWVAFLSQGMGAPSDYYLCDSRERPQHCALLGGNMKRACAEWYDPRQCNYCEDRPCSQTRQPCHRAARLCHS